MPDQHSSIDRRLSINYSLRASIVSEAGRMLRKKGSVLPSGENLGPYSEAIAYALKRELGPTHQAVKIIMKWTGAGERTAKNWLAGVSGPSGQHLVELIRNSDSVLQVLLTIAGRRQTSAVQHLGDLRNYLSRTLESIDQLIADE